MEFETKRLGVTEPDLWISAVIKLIPSSERKNRLVSKEQTVTALADDHMYMIVARDNEDCVGLLAAYRFPDLVRGGSLVYLYDIVVKPSVRRHGIGKSLIECLKKSCSKHAAQDLGRHGCLKMPQPEHSLKIPAQHWRENLMRNMSGIVRLGSPAATIDSKTKSSRLFRAFA